MKKESLTKSDLCWVLVKLAGAVLVYQALTAFYAAVVTWLSFSDAMEGMNSRNRSLAYAPVKVIFWSMLLPLVIGVRLLISGTTLHGWLMMVPLATGLDKGGKPVGGGTLAEKRLTPEEFEKYQKWSEGNSQIEGRDEVDRLALFRDAQRAGEV